jgi:hypothetical protein
MILTQAAFFAKSKQRLCPYAREASDEKKEEPITARVILTISY